MSELVWEAPPPSRRGKTYSPYQAVAAELRANPGRWALIRTLTVRPGGSPTAGYDLAWRVNQGRGAFAPAGDYEATTRREDGVAKTYARYLGDGPDGETR